ncbi:membrane protein of unknown function [Ruminococcaceae bacterium BL-6]|nr:membrane protein of unknown function [Ruminococcaceae bacterium BL-6]
MDQFFTWGTLATLAGASAAVGLLTQFFKDAIHVPTQWLSYIFSIIVLSAATLFAGSYSAPAWAIIPLNAVIVSIASNGAYTAILRAKDGKQTAGTSAQTRFKTADEARKAFPGLDNVTLEQINTAIGAANIALGKATDAAQQEQLKLALSALEALWAAKKAAGETGAK